MKNNVSNMSPLNIKVLMLKSHVTQAEIARKLGITIQTVNQVIHGRFNSHRVHQAVAEATGKDIRAIWPTVYLYGGGPWKRGRPFAEDSRKRATA